MVYHHAKNLPLLLGDEKEATIVSADRQTNKQTHRQTESKTDNTRSPSRVERRLLMVKCDSCRL